MFLPVVLDDLYSLLLGNRLDMCNYINTLMFKLVTVSQIYDNLGNNIYPLLGDWIIFIYLNFINYFKITLGKFRSYYKCFIYVLKGIRLCPM